MKACIVSMDYKTKNNDGTPKLKALNESYFDAKKVNQLLIKTLGWDERDIITFKDVSSKMTNLYNKINVQIERLKTAASVNTNENA